MELTPIRRGFRPLPVGKRIRLPVPASGPPYRTGKASGCLVQHRRSCASRRVEADGLQCDTKRVVGTARPPSSPQPRPERVMRWPSRILSAAPTAPEPMACPASATSLQIMRVRLLRKWAVPSGQGRSRAPSAGTAERVDSITWSMAPWRRACRQNLERGRSLNSFDLATRPYGRADLQPSAPACFPLPEPASQANRGCESTTPGNVAAAASDHGRSRRSLLLGRRQCCQPRAWPLNGECLLNSRSRRTPWTANRMQPAPESRFCRTMQPQRDQFRSPVHA